MSLKPWRWLLLIVLLALVAGDAEARKKPPKPPQPSDEYTYRAILPLGTDAVHLVPMNRNLYFIGSAYCKDFGGIRRSNYEDRFELHWTDGAPVRRYPSYVQFRITATARNHQLDVPSFDQHSDTTDLNDYLLKLKFRLKLFHGLQSTDLEPASVRLVGVPADTPYDERVYEIGVDLPDVSINDRIVLEVLSPEGQRLTKFHLDL